MLRTKPTGSATVAEKAVAKMMKAAAPLIAEVGDKMPKEFWVHHAKGCGTDYRGCAPDCPKDIYEKTGKWTGPTRRQAFEADLRRAVEDLIGEENDGQ